MNKPYILNSHRHNVKVSIYHWIATFFRKIFLFTELKSNQAFGRYNIKCNHSAKMFWWWLTQNNVGPHRSKQLNIFLPLLSCFMSYLLNGLSDFNSVKRSTFLRKMCTCRYKLNWPLCLWKFSTYICIVNTGFVENSIYKISTGIMLKSIYTDG